MIKKLCRPTAVAGACLLLFCAGCGGQQTGGYEKFVPSEDTAQKALAAALTDWKNGKPPGEVAGTSNPRVEMKDTQRRPGQVLKDFEILGVVPTGEGPKAFNVRLVLEKPHQELKVRFIVFGLDPLMVWSQEDYEASLQWDHHMDPVDLTKTAPKK